VSCGRGLAIVWLVVLALPASAAQLRLGSVLGDGGAEGFARAEEVRPFEFPADHGPHPRFRSEWWYLTASLETPDGAAYGVQFTVFRQALRPQPVFTGPWDASQLYLAHLALTDVAAGSHRQAERLGRGHPRLAGAVAAPFRTWVDGWSLSSADEGLAALSLQAATAAFDVDLLLQALKPMVLQGNRGLSA
jgi:predicted secreted hydrolase